MTGRKQKNCTQTQELGRTGTLEKIRSLNDALRRTGSGGMQVITPGIQALGIVDVAKLRHEIALYDAFTADNDPYGEHDFGSLKFRNKTVFWKIDYYTEDVHYGSPNAHMPPCVLTIMLATEY